MVVVALEGPCAPAQLPRPSVHGHCARTPTRQQQGLCRTFSVSVRSLLRIVHAAVASLAPRLLTARRRPCTCTCIQLTAAPTSHPCQHRLPPTAAFFPADLVVRPKLPLPLCHAADCSLEGEDLAAEADSGIVELVFSTPGTRYYKCGGEIGQQVTS